jgi:hypothetical protein
LARKPGILLGHNDAMYVALGESLRHFNYRELWYAGTPAHAMYPPVYPAVLAIFEAIHGNGFHWLVWSNVLASSAALALLFLAVRTSWGPLAALVSLAVLAVNPAIVTAGGTLGAETPMMLVIAVVIYALVHESRGAHMSVLAGFAALLAALLRIAAVPIVAAVTVYWLLHRRYKQVAIYALLTALSLGAWLLWSAAVPNQSPGRSYVSDAMVMSSHAGVLTELTSRVAGHIARYASIVYWDLPMPTVSSSHLDNAIGGPLALAALIVGLVAMARAWTAAGLFLGLYGGLLSVWPYVEDRFLVPVLPIVVICFVIGCMRLARQTARVPVIVGSGLLLVIMTSGTVSVATVAAHGITCNKSAFFPDNTCVTAEERGYFQAMRYIRDNTPGDAVFLSAKPATLYYYTGRHSIIRELAARQSPDMFLPFLKSQHADYLLLGRTDYTEIHRFAAGIRASCDSLDLVRRMQGGVYLFRVRADNRAAGDGRACEAIEQYDQDVKTRRRARS